LSARRQGTVQQQQWGKFWPRRNPLSRCASREFFAALAGNRRGVARTNRACSGRKTESPPPRLRARAKAPARRRLRLPRPSLVAAHSFQPGITGRRYLPRPAAIDNPIAAKSRRANCSMVAAYPGGRSRARAPCGRGRLGGSATRMGEGAGSAATPHPKAQAESPSLPSPARGDAHTQEQWVSARIGDIGDILWRQKKPRLGFPNHTFLAQALAESQRLPGWSRFSNVDNRTPDYESGGQEFESFRARQKYRNNGRNWHIMKSAMQNKIICMASAWQNVIEI
jgi:hypothetical protein